MAWDSDKNTAADPNNPQADEQLTADEWDNHVSEGHWPSDELNFGVDGNGDPVITDPQNGGQTVMRYDRSAGSWVVDALEAGTRTTTGITKGNIKRYDIHNLETDAEASKAIQYVDGVSTNSETIFKGSDFGYQGYLIHVVGSDQSKGAVNFTDIINFSPGTTNPPDIISSNQRETNGTPASRSYGVASNNDLTLAMSSDTYDITAHCVSGQRRI